MRELSVVGIVFAVTSFALFAGGLDARPSAGGSVIAVTAVDAVAVVVKTDSRLRTVTIEDPKGKNVTINIPPQLPLEQIQAGTLLDVRYVEAQALDIRGTGAAPADAVGSVVITPAIGTRVVTAKTRRVKGMISEINRRERELTIVGADDKPLALKVAPIVEGFDGVKVGDTTVIEYTEAAALSAVRHDDEVSSTRL
jgi:hypothetical protein